MFESRISRIALACALTAIGMAASKAHGQEIEFVVNSGTVVPTGVQRDAVKRAGLTAAQLSYVVHSKYAVTGTFGWARSRDIATAGDPRLDLFTYDLGAEVRPASLKLGETTSFRPFAGLGAGGRTYNYRSLDVDATHNVAAYGSIGGELGVRRVRLRGEVRDYVTGFKPLNGSGRSDTRNDVSLMFGLRLASK